LARIQITAYSSFEFRSCNPVISDCLKVFALGTRFFGFCAKELIVKVRENLTSYDDPGWYENPPGTLASLAGNDELQRDLGFAPSSEKREKPMDNMNMDHMKMQHGHGG